ncbi:hypothetical protein [Lutibacter flavus]|uniref:Uncharacterized protein n=1 Tax=Lutibacter flavus TaxID=691689 RepID=A0A238VQT7_9FLAO|nr:hypothetical protein [Lutibacter flavus]SNR36596.1 hypothetical protein SAMN04488111_0890 [Lutibacter flavus]
MIAIVIQYYKYTFFEETLQSFEHQKDKRFNAYLADVQSLKKSIAIIGKYI